MWKMRLEASEAKKKEEKEREKFVADLASLRVPLYPELEISASFVKHPLYIREKKG